MAPAGLAQAHRLDEPKVPGCRAEGASRSARSLRRRKAGPVRVAGNRRRKARPEATWRSPRKRKRVRGRTRRLQARTNKCERNDGRNHRARASPLAARVGPSPVAVAARDTAKKATGEGAGQISDSMATAGAANTQEEEHHDRMLTFVTVKLKGVSQPAVKVSERTLATSSEVEYEPRCGLTHWREKEKVRKKS